MFKGREVKQRGVLICFYLMGKGRVVRKAAKLQIGRWSLVSVLCGLPLYLNPNYPCRFEKSLLISVLAQFIMTFILCYKFECHHGDQSFSRISHKTGLVPFFAHFKFFPFCSHPIIQMNRAKQFVLECDIFSHGSLQRYKEQESYRTLAGGVTSIILIFFFSIVFANLVLGTLQKSIIVSSQARNYHDDPQYGQFTVDPDKNYMFAIGLTGIDLSSSQRYFDILLTKKTHTNNGTVSNKTQKSVPLTPCVLEQWGGVTDSISRSFITQNFNQWLCPPVGTNITLEGKFSSESFQFAEVQVRKCTNNNLFPNTTCKSSAQIASFLDSNGQFTFNFYFINPVVNPQNSSYIAYYLEDSNYFAFDTNIGVTANLFYSDYTVTTDTTIFPWSQLESISGYMTTEVAIPQNYQISSKSNQYLRFYIRKAAYQFSYTRSFQKLDQTFSYIGGLFSTIVLFLLFLKLYSKYSYELNLGDKIFKQNNGGSFGSQHFNFVVFMGYMIYMVLSQFGMLKNWKAMRLYHECRTQCQKQLNLDLMLQKLTHFEEIAKILMEEHHLKMLMIVPKPTINEIKLTRKRYLMKSIVYHQLERKGREIYVDQSQYKRRLRQFLKQKEHQDLNEMMDVSDISSSNKGSFKGLKRQMATSFKKLQNNEMEDQISISKKIKDRLSVEEIMTAIFEDIRPLDNQFEIEQSSASNKALSIEPRIAGFEENRSQVEMIRVRKLEPLSRKDKRSPTHMKLVDDNQQLGG